MYWTGSTAEDACQKRIGLVLLLSINVKHIVDSYSAGDTCQKRIGLEVLLQIHFKYVLYWYYS
jgi:hypothetical protein